MPSEVEDGASADAERLGRESTPWGGCERAVQTRLGHHPQQSSSDQNVLKAYSPLTRILEQVFIIIGAKFLTWRAEPNYANPGDQASGILLVTHVVFLDSQCDLV
ncbi:hypothetical protein IF1G_00365 [Cordyceps javanica]|uniref:Uncharacterized protein n=1 Tax=Cordyceps javanica TaxID=43265 RepID=A0A545VFD3_9HYPO|nr:hypothetical protein IF1G_00365 [Cordyceps javanica]